LFPAYVSGVDLPKEKAWFIQETSIQESYLALSLHFSTLAVPKARLDGVWGNLGWAEVSLTMAGVGIRWALRSLPTQTFQWFYNFMIRAVFRPFDHFLPPVWGKHKKDVETSEQTHLLPFAPLLWSCSPSDLDQAGIRAPGLLPCCLFRSLCLPGLGSSAKHCTPKSIKTQFTLSYLLGHRFHLLGEPFAETLKRGGILQYIEFSGKGLSFQEQPFIFKGLQLCPVPSVW